MSPVRATPLMLSIPHSLTVMCIWDFSHHFQVQDIPKEKPYEVDLNHFFQDVDALLSIAFQIAIHNRRKKAKANGEELPPSKRRGKVKQAVIHQGDGIQGTSAAEILEKKQEELAERRKRRDETTDESEKDIDDEVTGEQRRPGGVSADPIVRTHLQYKSERLLLHPSLKELFNPHLETSSSSQLVGLKSLVLKSCSPSESLSRIVSSISILDTLATEPSIGIVK